LVNGKRLHKSRDFIGRRYSLVFFTHTEAARLSRRDQEVVRTAGFRTADPKEDLPSAASDRAEFARVGAHKNVLVRTTLLKRKKPERTAREATDAIAFHDRLRPAPLLSQKEADEREAVGGMRHPARAVARLPLAVQVGRKIRQALEEHLSANPLLESRVVEALQLDPEACDRDALKTIDREAPELRRSGPSWLASRAPLAWGRSGTRIIKLLCDTGFCRLGLEQLQTRVLRQRTGWLGALLRASRRTSQTSGSSLQ